MEFSYKEGRNLLNLAETDDVPLIRGSAYEISEDMVIALLKEPRIADILTVNDLFAKVSLCYG